jgi:hypothetical protein
MDSRLYVADNFEIWKKQDAWFWRVFNIEPNGAAVGAAATEAEAVREARLYIEQGQNIYRSDR